MGLYSAYRTLGLVCDGASLARPLLLRRGAASFVVTPVDCARSLQLYDVDKLHLRGATPRLAPADGHITSVAAIGGRLFAAAGCKIIVLEAMRIVASWDTHQTPVDILLAYGEYLVSVSSKARRMVTHALDGEVKSDVRLDDTFETSAIVHPATYLNKVLLGAVDGRLQLWNIRTKSKIYEFESFGSAITALESSPVVDVVAVGLQDGRVILHNIRADETLLEFEHRSQRDEATAVTGLAFRTDGDETLVSTSEDGTLVVWDLNAKRLRCISHGVHRGGSAIVEFLPNEPLLITCGRFDNCLKVHLFDAPNGAPRVLRHRAGHCSAPTKLEFCGKDPRQMISAGSDREVRLISLIRDAQNRALSQGQKRASGTASARKRRRLAGGIEVGAEELPNEFNRLPPVVALASGDTRRRDLDFANVVTGHRGLREAYLWRLDDSSLKSGVLLHRREEAAPVTAVLVSHCGNYSVVGSESGHLDLYNLQSARHVGEFRRSKTERAHESRITGLASDGCGDMVVSAGEKDGMLRFWELRSRSLLYSIKTEASPLGIRWCRTSDLLAVRADDFAVYVYDAETKRLARCLRGHTGPITDVSFSGDGKWVVSGSMDCSIRTWDLPSGKCVDVLMCPTAPVSVAVSPDSAYVASAHNGTLGVALWVNRTHFDMNCTGSLQGSFRCRATQNALPGIYDGWEESNPDQQSEDGDVEQIEKENPSHKEIIALDSQLVTLSGHPASHWTPLSNLEAIKARNKPKERVKKPDDVPFFLPTTKELQPRFELDPIVDTKTTKGTAENTIQTPGLGLFGGLVIQKRFNEAAMYLNELPPSGVDFELRCLDSKDGRRKGAMYFIERLQNRSYFELTQAHLGVFLRVHGVELASEEGGRQLLVKMQELQFAGWDSLRRVFATSLTLTSFLSGQQS